MQVIDATRKGNISRFINHSCEPNARTARWIVARRTCVGFFAIKAIAAGEEVTFDYKYERFRYVLSILEADAYAESVVHTRELMAIQYVARKGHPMSIMGDIVAK